MPEPASPFDFSSKVTSSKSFDYRVLAGKYQLHSTIGSGGFAKVKCATHKLTGEKVAIKIMDREKLGEDAHRVVTEIGALKTLSHQNIAQLYEVLESESKIFVILEYCAGGELFDYIIKRDRLPESEARQFFRQILAAIAYVHSKNFAHRDLKPENILLGDRGRLKLIDFGLCARPEGGMANPLRTACGSPAYAAPELIGGSGYLGNQVDPKDRISVENLLSHPWVRQNGAWGPLKWQSIYEFRPIDAECARMMAPCFNCNEQEMIKRLSKWEYDYATSTYGILSEQKRTGRRMRLLQATPSINRHLLPRPMVEKKQFASPTILTSPTIHASLEKGLDTVSASSTDYDDDDDLYYDSAFANENEENSSTSSDDDDDDEFRKFHDDGTNDENLRTPAKFATTKSYTLAVEKSPLRPKTPPNLPPRSAGKENRPPLPPKSATANRPATVAVPPPPPIVVTKGKSPKSVYYTPARNQNIEGKQLRETPSVPIPKSTYYRYESPKPKLPLPSPAAEPSGHARNAPVLCTPIIIGRSPRSSRKTGSGRRRIVHSLERGWDRVVKAVTPRRRLLAAAEGPKVVKHIEKEINVTTTSSKDPEVVIAALVDALKQTGIICMRRGYTLHGRFNKRTDTDPYATDGTKPNQVQRFFGLEIRFILEIVWYKDQKRDLNLIGIRRKRIQGDSYAYKWVIESVLNAIINI